MDINPSDLKASEHMITWSHNDFPQNQAETKSFRCSFCKRGFSNAQALGGHMNIHRKDRAKLKELSEDLDSDVPADDDRKHSPPPDSSAGKISRPENDESPIEENPDRGLPLFAKAVNVDDGGDGEEAERCRFEKHVELSYGELDLELRLGLEPHHAKSKP